ncbi:MAG TPA: phosphatase PAP2 family protein [Vicinamibacterales bacterium]
MFPFEWLAVLYFAALALAAVALRRGRPRARRAFLDSIALVVMAMVAGWTTPTDVRAWLGHAYLLAGYRIPSLLAPTAADTRFERWLVETDRAWRPSTSAIPRPMAHIFEVAYLLCYPLVPAAFAVVWARGDDNHINRFWMAVLASGFACYGLLPWLASRPPRSLPDAERPGSGLARFNVRVLERASHGLNTFPSGHVGVAVAAALSVWPVSPAAAIVFGVVATGVAIGAVTGRYHYVPDVVIGAAVGLLLGS